MDSRPRRGSSKSGRVRGDDLGGRLDTVAFGAIEVKDGGTMDDSIDCGHGGHFIFEDFELLNVVCS